MHIKKFWYPADTVPADVGVPLLSIMGEITSAFSKTAKPTPEERKTLKYVWQIDVSLTLPERQEDYRLDCAEFQYRLKWRKEIPSGKIKQEKSVQREGNWDVVYYCDVDVPTIRAENS